MSLSLIWETGHHVTFVMLSCGHMKLCGPQCVAARAMFVLSCRQSQHQVHHSMTSWIYGPRIVLGVLCCKNFPTSVTTLFPWLLKFDWTGCPRAWVETNSRNPRVSAPPHWCTMRKCWWCTSVCTVVRLQSPTWRTGSPGPIGLAAPSCRNFRLEKIPVGSAVVLSARLLTGLYPYVQDFLLALVIPATQVDQGHLIINADLQVCTNIGITVRRDSARLPF